MRQLRYRASSVALGRALSLALILMQLAACAHTPLPAVANHPASEYELNQANRGLRIAVDLFTDEPRLVQFFGANLLSRKVLPVLVVLENAGPEPWLIQTRHILFRTKSQRALVPYDVREAANARVNEEVSNAYLGGAAGAALSALPFVFLLPGTVASGVAIAKENELRATRNSIMEKALEDVSIYPTQLHKGFVYFPLGPEDTLDDLATLSITASRIPTQERLLFEFHFGSVRHGHRE